MHINIMGCSFNKAFRGFDVLISKIEDTVRIHQHVWRTVKETAVEVLNENYMGKIDKSWMMVTVKK